MWSRKPVQIAEYRGNVAKALHVSLGLYAGHQVLNTCNCEMVVVGRPYGRGMAKQSRWLITKVGVSFSTASCDLAQLTYSWSYLLGLADVSTFKDSKHHNVYTYMIVVYIKIHNICIQQIHLFPYRHNLCNRGNKASWPGPNVNTVLCWLLASCNMCLTDACWVLEGYKFIAVFCCCLFVNCVITRDVCSDRLRAAVSSGWAVTAQLWIRVMYTRFFGLQRHMEGTHGGDIQTKLKLVHLIVLLVPCSNCVVLVAYSQHQ